MTTRGESAPVSDHDDHDHRPDDGPHDGAVERLAKRMFGPRPEDECDPEVGADALRAGEDRDPEGALVEEPDQGEALRPGPGDEGARPSGRQAGLKREGNLLEALRGSDPAIAAPWLEREHPAAVAVLFRILGPEAAGPYLAALPEAAAVAVLRVIRESANAASDEVPRLLAAAYGEAGAARIDATTAGSAQAALPGPFAFLAELPVEVAGRLLGRWDPTSIAVVLAHVEPEQGAALLDELPEALQGLVAVALARGVAVSEARVRDLETALRDADAAVRTLGLDRGVGGPRAMALIVNSSKVGSSVLASIEALDRDVARAVSDQRFVFADLARQDQRTLMGVVRACDVGLIARALRGADTPVREAFFSIVSDRVRENVIEEMELLALLTPLQVLEARAEIVARARKLDDEGLIILRFDWRPTA